MAGGRKRKAKKSPNRGGEEPETQNVEAVPTENAAQGGAFPVDNGDEKRGRGLRTGKGGKKQKMIVDKSKDGHGEQEDLLQQKGEKACKETEDNIVIILDGSEGESSERARQQARGQQQQLADDAENKREVPGDGEDRGALPGQQGGMLERDGGRGDADLGGRSVGVGDVVVVAPSLVNQAISYLRLKLIGVAGGDSGRLGGPLLKEMEDNRSKLHQLLHNTVENAYNNSALLLGPRGCGKTLVLETVLADLQKSFPDRLAPVRLNGLLHADDRASLKEIARQLCLEHHMTFSKASSFDENLAFLTNMLRDCANAHRAVIFVLDEFDLFAQRPKQTVLYNLLDAMQSSQAQAAVVGISCRLDADQLLEKRVRSRFSHRRFLFLPPTPQEAPLLLKGSLSLQQHPSLGGTEYAKLFEEDLERLLRTPKMQILLANLTATDLSPRHLMDLAFRAVCYMDRKQGTLSAQNFTAAAAALRVQPKMSLLKGVSVLELFLLVAMKRLEGREREAYNFHTIFTEYEQLRKVGTQSSADMYPRNVALRAFEHLVERELVGFTDERASCSGMPEFRMAQLLITPAELEIALKNCSTCPNVLRTWFANEAT